MNHHTMERFTAVKRLALHTLVFLYIFVRMHLDIAIAHSGAKSISNFKMADVSAVSAQIID